MTIKWTEAQDGYLACNFDTAEMSVMVDVLGRSHNAIYYRAKVLGLRRRNRGHFAKGFIRGTPFRPGSTSWNAGTAKPKTPLRDKIIDLLAAHQDQTISQMMEVTGSSASSCWRVCNLLRAQGNLHIVEYRPAPGNWEAVYRIGCGVDAEKPGPDRVRPANEPDPYEIQPVPRPQLGAWGLSWNTTNNTQEITA